MDKKAARLNLLKEIARRHEEREGILFTGIPTSNADITETVAELDTFMEDQRDRRSNSGINSDE